MKKILCLMVLTAGFAFVTFPSDAVEKTVVSTKGVLVSGAQTQQNPIAPVDSSDVLQSETTQPIHPQNMVKDALGIVVSEQEAIKEKTPAKIENVPNVTMPVSKPGAPKPRSAVAVIKGTAMDSKINGTIIFTEVRDGVKVEGQVMNVPEPGKHGFHIHDNGMCDNAGQAAGNHFNPDNAPHGLLAKDGYHHAHAGDLGNIDIDANGNGKYSAIIPGLSLDMDQRYYIGNRSVIIHAKTDDFGQPNGNAGERIGCGIIVGQ